MRADLIEIEVSQRTERLGMMLPLIEAIKTTHHEMMLGRSRTTAGTATFRFPNRWP
jgi:hypothetical protein